MKRKWYVTAIIVMFFFLLIPEKSYAAKKIITKLYYVIDMEAVDLNVNWTEGEIRTRLCQNTKIDTAGVRLDIENAYFKESGSQYKEERKIKKDTIYCVGIKNHCISEEYDWPEEIKDGDNDFSGVIIIVNGENVTEKCSFIYNKSWNYLNVEFPIGIATTDGRVTSIAISEKPVYVVAGKTGNFSASVYGTEENKNVNWRIEGAKSANTKINSSGVLTVGSDETATSITVWATSQADNSFKCSVSIPVFTKEPTIDSVKISPKNVTVLQNSTQSFEVTVAGNHPTKDVKWEISGAKSSNTKFRGDILTIGFDETAETINVKAISKINSAAFDTAIVTVKKTTKISDISLKFDASTAKLYTTWTVGDANDRMVETVSLDDPRLKLNAKSGMGLLYYEGGSFRGFSSRLVQVRSDINYYMEFSVGRQTGYEWPDSAWNGDYSEIKIIVNGEDVTDKCNVSLYKTGASMTVRYPLGKASDCGCVNSVLQNAKEPTCSEEGYTGDMVCTNCLHVTKRGKAIATLPHKELTTISKASFTTDGKIETKCTVCGKVTKTETIHAVKNASLAKENYSYDGKAKKPAVTVKDSAGNKLANGDYTVSYSSGRKKIGKYTATVTLKGNKYSGTKKLTFKIVPPKPTLSSAKAGSKSMTLKWKKGKEATGYEIQYSTSKTFAKGNKSAKITSAKTTSKVIKKLKAKKTYYVRLRSYKTVKGTKYYSDWTAKKTVKIK